MQYTTDTFRPARWCANRHMQTVIPSLPFYRAPVVRYVREAVDLPDGDFVDIDWCGRNANSHTPVLIVLPGLEGSSDSAYSRTIAHAASEAGWSVAVMHYRGCSGRPNRLPRRYHAGDTDDLAFLAERLRDEYPDRTLLAVGYSLGGNVLLKYLGERAESSVIDAAVAVCVPFDLHDSAEALSQGPAQFYQHWLIRRMRRNLRDKYRPDFAPFDWENAMRARTFYEFDDQVTAPLHGFRGVDDYYSRSSSGQFLPAIRRPALLISALDDPFMTGKAFPDPARLPDTVRTEFTERGGHVGFVSGHPASATEYWLHARTMGYFVDELGIAAPASQPADPVSAFADSHAG